MCYTSCFAAVGVTGAFAGPKILHTLGFTTSGIKAGSWAAEWMSLYGGNVKAADLFAKLQADGAKGAMKWTTGIPYVNDVCNYLCYNE